MDNLEELFNGEVELWEPEEVTECMVDESDEDEGDSVFDSFEKSFASAESYKKEVVIYPSELDENGFMGKLYGYNRDKSGVCVVLGYEGNVPAPELDTYEIGAIGEAQENGLMGERTENGLEFFYMSDGNKTPLIKSEYDLTQNIFSRNSGLMESDWMADKCAIIVGCGSVGSVIALQLARSGVGNFVLIDTDIMEIHNVCRHQCNLSDVGVFKVDALKERILQINPKAKVKTFIDTVQNVPTDEYSEYLNENSVIFACGDNRVCNAFASDIAFHYGFPFVATGFWQRASVCEIFYAIPGENHKCYRCSFEGPIRESAERLARDRFYVGEEAQEAMHFEPGISADIEYGSTIATKLGLDLFNRNNDKFTPRLIHEFKQYTLICNTCDERIGGEKVKYFFKHPLEKVNVIPTGKEDCVVCSKKD